MKKLNKYSQLYRPKALSNQYYFTPNVAFRMSGPIRISSSLNNPSYGVFAYKNSVSHETILRFMKDNTNIHYIVVPEDFIFIRQKLEFGDELHGNIIPVSASSIAIWIILLQLHVTKTRLINLDYIELLNSVISDHTLVTKILD